MAKQLEHKMTNGMIFRGMVSNGTKPEVYGWLELNHDIVKDSGGYWRTDDMAEAAKRCANAFGYTLADPVNA